MNANAKIAQTRQLATRLHAALALRWLDTLDEARSVDAAGGESVLVGMNLALRTLAREEHTRRSIGQPGWARMFAAVRACYLAVAAESVAS